MLIENKENIRPVLSRPNPTHKKGDIIIVQQRKQPQNLNVLRKLSPNVPEESNQMFSMTSSASEKSISEGFLHKNIPDS